MTARISLSTCFMLTIIFRVLPIGSENNVEVVLYQSLNFHSWTRDDNFKLNDSLEVIFFFVRDGIERPLAGDMAKGTIRWNLGRVRHSIFTL